MEKKQVTLAEYVRVAKDPDQEEWSYTREDGDGNVVDSGKYKVNPYIALRWCAVAGENYGRSHCEDIIGDISTLESFTESLLEGVAAGSAFWIGINPAGITELDDIAGAGNGSFVAARQEDVYTISPANTMNSQIQATQQGVEIMRREVGNAFLLSGSAIPKGERVIATAVRMIGSELETVLVVPTPLSLEILRFRLLIEPFILCYKTKRLMKDCLNNLVRMVSYLLKL